MALGLVAWDTSKFDRKLKQEQVRRLTLAGLVVEGHSKRVCPKVTGHLARSISTAPTPGALPSPLPSEISGGSTPLRVGDTSIFVGTNVFYGVYVEYGTRYFSGRYFMHRGLDLSRRQIQMIFG